MKEPRTTRKRALYSQRRRVHQRAQVCKNSLTSPTKLPCINSKRDLLTLLLRSAVRGPRFVCLSAPLRICNCGRERKEEGGRQPRAQIEEASEGRGGSSRSSERALIKSPTCRKEPRKDNEPYRCSSRLDVDSPQIPRGGGGGGGGEGTGGGGVGGGGGGV